MTRCLSERWQKLMTFIGGYIVLLPNGITWYWGNVSIYVYSYFHHKNQSNLPQDVKTPWLLSLYTISLSFAIMVSGYINAKMGRRPTILLGAALVDGGLIASYFVFSYSMSLLDVTMGLFCGLGNGLLYAMILQTYIEWTVKRVGLATSFLLSTYAIGSILTNQIITHYLNPDNKKVDVVIGKTHFFSQEEILDKVPSMFLALSTCSAVFHMTGFLLVRLKKTKSDESTKEKAENIVRKGSIRLPNPNTALPQTREPNIDGSQRDQFRKGSLCITNQKNFLSTTKEPTRENLGNIQTIDSDNYMSYDSMNSPNEWIDECAKIRTESWLDINELKVADALEKSPCHVLRTRYFYVFWLTMVGADCAFITLSNYYKVFGQVWIKDDHFLTNIGTTVAVCTVGMRIVWGILTDFVAIKPVIISLTSGLCLVCTFLFFTPSLSKWLFFLATVAVGSLNCGLYINFIVAMHTLYGKVNFTKNYGMLASATITLNLIFPPVAKLILSHFGWFWLFFSIGSLNFCSLIAIVLALPE